MNRPPLRIGRVLRPQGIRGEVKIRPLTDDVSRFDGLHHVLIERHDGQYAELALTVNRYDAKAVYAYLSGCHSREAAESYRNAYLCIPRDAALPLDEHSWYISDLIGLSVLTGPQQLGVLVQVIRTGAVDVYAVQKPQGGLLMFPALKRLIVHVDIGQGVMLLDGAVLQEVRVDED